MGVKFFCKLSKVFGCMDRNRIAIVLPLVSSILSTLLSRCFSFLSKWERHLSDQTAVLVAIFRSLLAKVALMACVIYEFTRTRINSCDPEKDVECTPLEEPIVWV